MSIWKAQLYDRKNKKHNKYFIHAETEDEALRIALKFVPEGVYINSLKPYDGELNDNALFMN